MCVRTGIIGQGGVGGNIVYCCSDWMKGLVDQPSIVSWTKKGTMRSFQHFPGKILLHCYNGSYKLLSKICFFLLFRQNYTP